MLASQRKQQILQILAVEKQVMSGELSQRFNVSEDSIRRDLRELAGKASCSGSTAARCRFRRPSRRSKQEKRANRFKAGHCPPGGGADPAGAGGDYRWRDHDRRNGPLSAG